MTELLLLRSAHRLMLVDTCIKFLDIQLKPYSSYRADTVFVMDKVPRKITQKI